jgi:hypothetical protein
MMRTLFCSLLIIFGAGCRYSPIDSANQSRTIVRGNVIIEGVADTFHRDFSGAKVELIGTGLVTHTTQSGYWEIIDVPSGSYDLEITKEGFDTIYQSQVLVLAPSGYTYLNPIRLRRPRHVGVSIFVDPIMKVGGVCRLFDSSFIATIPECPVLLVAGKSRTVSKDPESFEWYSFEIPRSDWMYFDPIGVEYGQLKPGSLGFKSGDSVYFVAYLNGWGYMEASSKYDPKIGMRYYFNLYNRSGVVGAIVR